MNPKITSGVQLGQETKKQVQGRWSKTEHERFMKALEKYGRSWVDVQKYVRTRNLSQVRSHAQKIFMKMSDQDIEAMIMGDRESDYEDMSDRLETVDQQKTKGTRTSLRRKKSDRVEEREEKTNQQRPKEDLLQIFKRAIDLQTLSLNNENESQSAWKEPEHPISPQLSPSHADGQPVQQITSSFKTIGINSRTFEEMAEQLKAQPEEYHEHSEQMSFIAPDLKRIFEASEALAL